MSDLMKRKFKQQQQNDARKARQGEALLQKKGQDQEDDDDGSGGGPGKRRQNGFKLEKLLDAIAKGRQKAQAFWRFLGKEGLDISDTKKTDLAKQREKVEKSSDKNLANEKSEKSKERALELKKERESSTVAESSESNQPAWEKAQAADSSNRSQMFGVDNNRNADISRRSVMGNRLAGSIANATANPLGFTKQVELVGDGRALESQSQGSLDIQGGRVQGAIHSKHQDHVGTQHFNHSGKDNNQFAFSKGVRATSNAGQVNQGQSSQQVDPSSTTHRSSIRSRG